MAIRLAFGRESVIVLVLVPEKFNQDKTLAKEIERRAAVFEPDMGRAGARPS